LSLVNGDVAAEGRFLRSRISFPGGFLGLVTIFLAILYLLTTLLLDIVSIRAGGGAFRSVVIRLSAAVLNLVGCRRGLTPLGKGPGGGSKAHRPNDDHGQCCQGNKTVNFHNLHLLFLIGDPFLFTQIILSLTPLKQGFLRTRQDIDKNLIRGKTPWMGVSK
jgi:hypothetical protein